MGKKRIGIIIVVAVIVLVGLVMFLRTRGPALVPPPAEPVAPAPEEPKVIKIGAIWPLTGDLGMYGTWAKHGIDLAVEEINAKGGIRGRKVQVICEDDRGDPKEAVNAINKLVTIDKVPVVIGPGTSSAVLAVAPIAERSRVVVFSATASSPEITHAGEYIFRNWPSDIYEGRVMAKFAFEELNLTKIAILYVNNDYGVGAKDVFAKQITDLDGSILLTEGYEQGSTDFRTQLTKIKNKSPDAIYAPGYSKELGLILRQAKEMGLRVQFLSGVDFEGPKTLEIAGEAAEGAIYTIPGKFDPKATESVVQDFLTKYRKKYNTDPESFAAHAYDATNIVLLAIKNGGYHADGIKEALYEVKDYPGVTGPTTIDKFGDVEKSPLIKTVKNGKFCIFEKKGPRTKE